MNEIETVSNLCSSILIVDPTYNGAVWLKDMISVSALTCIGDGIAQTAQIISNYCDRFENRIKIQENSLPTNKWNNLSQNLKPSATVLLNSIYKEFDMNRFRNFAVFGFLDGAVSHSWFLLLDHFIKGHQLIDILARILADNLLYTSVWCAWFISAMALVEYIFTAEDKRPNLLEFNASKFLAEVLDLFKASFRVVFPVTCVLYTITPPSHRVTVSALGSTIYTIVVSLWNSSKAKSISTVPTVTEPLETAIMNDNDNIHNNNMDRNLISFIFSTTTMKGTS